MTDAFALLEQPRRPWLEAEQLKQRFHELTAIHHPDVAGGDSPGFARMNTAYNTLREPRLRLRHLLELEAPELLAQKQQIPTERIELFMAAGMLQQHCKVFLSKLEAAQSPLTKALLAGEQFQLLEQVEQMVARLEALELQLLEQLRQLDRIWNSRPLAELRGMYEAFAFVNRWQGQMRESYARLAGAA